MSEHDPPPHGTRSRYNWRFGPCNCDACTAANTTDTRTRRAAVRAGTYAPRAYRQPKRRIKLPEKYVLLPPHGTHERYMSRLSPCREACCREANAAYMREYRNRA